jgi:hypothetical protein
MVMQESWCHSSLGRHGRDGRTRVPVVSENRGECAEDLSAPLGAIAWSAHILVI